MNLTDGNSFHSVALYFLDWDNAGRSERVDVLDASSNAVLDTRTISAFQGGQYLLWNLAGHVTFQITLTGGPNAVLSGLFFGARAPVVTAAAANFARIDSSTQGTWKGTYGTDGDAIFSDSSIYPSYAQVSLSGNSAAVWAASTTDIRALQKLASTDRIAPVWYTYSSISIDVNLTDANAHSVALYFLDWDNQGRTESVEVLDPLSNTVLDTRTISNFQEGQYLVWNLRGHVNLRISGIGGINSVFSGLFFGPPVPTVTATATVLTTDALTQGTWKGTYGADGEANCIDLLHLPLYAAMNVTGGSTIVWTFFTSDVRALQELTSSARVALVWYTNSIMNIDLNLLDGNAHSAALYFLDRG